MNDREEIIGRFKSVVRAAKGFITYVETLDDAAVAELAKQMRKEPIPS